MNTDKDEDDPHLTTDGILYFTVLDKGKPQVLTSTRNPKTRKWQPAKPAKEFEDLGECRGVYMTSHRFEPQYLYYGTRKEGNQDIYFLIKQFKGADFTEPTPVQGVCTDEDELFPWLTALPAGALQLHFSRKDKDGKWHLFVTRKAKGERFGTPQRVDLPDDFHHATLTSNGKTMYLQGPLGKRRWGLFVTQSKDGKQWSPPKAIEELNDPTSPTGDRSPCLSREGDFLYFASDRKRTDSAGGLDIWMVRTSLIGTR